MSFMKEVLVTNRDMAPHHKPKEPTAVISIHTPGDTGPKFPEDVFADVLHMEFSDVNRSQHKKHGDNLVCASKLFGRKEAKEILRFVNHNLSRGVAHFLVHCDAGISRSPAVALALREIYMGLRDVPPRYDLYNRTVYYELMMVQDEMRLDGEWPEGVVPPVTGIIWTP